MKDTHFNSRGHGGFTLLELLTSMAILGVMIALLFEVFGQATRAWLQGENRVETFTQGRAILDFMSRDLSQAIANSNVTFMGTETNVAFITAAANDSSGVDLEEVIYFRSGTSLVRQAIPFSAGAAWNFYTQPQTWPATASGISTVADNIISLTLSYMGTNGVVMPGGPLLPSWWNSGTIATTWAAGIQAGPSEVMTNRTPAGVQITIGAVDTRSMVRLQTILQPSGVTNASNVGPFTNMLNQAAKYFTTFVAIPGGQP